MESARRVGLPPAYEDADIDALCQLIGTLRPNNPRKTNFNNLPYSYTTTALMLDHLISINDRIPLSPCVSTQALLSTPTHHDLIYF